MKGASLVWNVGCTFSIREQSIVDWSEGILCVVSWTVMRICNGLIFFSWGGFIQNTIWVCLNWSCLFLCLRVQRDGRVFEILRYLIWVTELIFWLTFNLWFFGIYFVTQFVVGIYFSSSYSVVVFIGLFKSLTYFDIKFC